MDNVTRCAVVGYGSWATTLVGQLTHKGINVNWLITNNEVSSGILSDGHNPKYVNELELDITKLNISTDINDVVTNCEVILLACPSAWLTSYLEPLTVSIRDKYIISAVKGIVPTTLNTVLEYIQHKYDVPFEHLGLISGPTHAEEVSRGRLSFLTIAAISKDARDTIEYLFSGQNLILNTSTDVLGIEYAAVLKNIYAIAIGLASGIGYGENFIAVLIATCANEMENFLNTSFPNSRNIHSAAYLGDLIVTCYSNYSRNRRLGLLIGRGNTVKSAMNEMTMVAEGYFSADCIRKVNEKCKADMPIATMVYNVLYKHENPRKAMAELAKKLG